MLYLDRALARERRQRRAAVIDINLAHAGGEAATRHLKDLGD
ncbi:MAG TPA: hypothetical protein VF216_04695 [Mizugakiibacter sp.]